VNWSKWQQQVDVIARTSAGFITHDANYLYLVPDLWSIVRKVAVDDLLHQPDGVVMLTDSLVFEFKDRNFTLGKKIGPLGFDTEKNWVVGESKQDGGDIFGDGVNVATRLESIADRGGICISRQVLDQIEGKLDLNFRELGRQNLKNIAKPVEVYAIQLHGAVSPGSRFLAAADLKQEIRYCKAPDGVRLAYATAGSGPPMLRSAHWLGHLEYDWELPILQHFLLRLAKDHALVRYDARGNGLSDWDVHEISLDAWVSDMETVADAAGLDRFPLLGFSQGCFAAMKTLVKQGWGADNPAFRQIFTSLMMPAATKDQADAFNELQRLSASPECAVRYLETVADLDVRELLSQVKAPTPVMHVRDEPMVPSELGRKLAAGIPSARFVALPGRNHVLLEQDPGLPRFIEELKEFLKNAI
jgi:pimeloyl-ACP methyl ester carboxylesterase